MMWHLHSRLARHFAGCGVAALALASVSVVAADMKVLVAPVVSAPLIKQLPLSGTIASPQFSALATRVDGYVEKLLVDVGDSVQAGDPLLELDSRLASLERHRSKRGRSALHYNCRWKWQFTDACARLASPARHPRANHCAP